MTSVRPTTSALTAKQAAALEAIQEHGRRHNRMPSRRELAHLLGINVASAHAYVLTLERKGYLHNQPNTRCGVRLTDGTGPEARAAALERLASSFVAILPNDPALAAWATYDPLGTIVDAINQLFATGWRPTQDPAP